MKSIEDKELIVEWFNHIAQMADDRKTANGKVASAADTLDEIKVFAKECAWNIENL